jgi:hypothetical protein
MLIEMNTSRIATAQEQSVELEQDSLDILGQIYQAMVPPPLDDAVIEEKYLEYILTQQAAIDMRGVMQVERQAPTMTVTIFTCPWPPLHRFPSETRTASICWSGSETPSATLTTIETPK